MIEELVIQETYGSVKTSKGKIVFSGIRPEDIMSELEKNGWEISNSLSAKTTYLVVKDPSDETGKITKAKEIGVPIISVDKIMDIINK